MKMNLFPKVVLEAIKTIVLGENDSKTGINIIELFRSTNLTIIISSVATKKFCSNELHNNTPKKHILKIF